MEGVRQNSLAVFCACLRSTWYHRRITGGHSRLQAVIWACLLLSSPTQTHHCQHPKSQPMTCIHPETHPHCPVSHEIDGLSPSASSMTEPCHFFGGKEGLPSSPTTGPMSLTAGQAPSSRTPWPPLKLDQPWPSRSSSVCLILLFLETDVPGRGGTFDSVFHPFLPISQEDLNFQHGKSSSGTALNSGSSGRKRTIFYCVLKPQM